MAQQVRRAAALTAELAAQSEKTASVVCDPPRALRDELAEHIEAPNMEVGGSHSLATTMMQEESTALAVTSHQFDTAAVGSPRPATQSLRACRGVSRPKGTGRSARPKSAWRVLSVATTVEEIVGFFVEATGKCADSMRLELTTRSLEDLQRSREYWQAAEEKQHFQDKKEEAWELFRSQATLRPKNDEGVRERL